MNKKVVFFIISIIIILGIVFIVKPKSGTFDKLILNEYDKNNFTKIILTHAKESQEIKSSDKEKINQVLNYFKDLNLAEYRKNLNIPEEDMYTIRIYCDDGNSLGIEMYNKNKGYLTIHNKYGFKNYKLVHTNINIEELKELFI